MQNSWIIKTAFAASIFLFYYYIIVYYFLQLFCILSSFSLLYLLAETYCHRRTLVCCKLWKPAGNSVTFWCVGAQNSTDQTDLVCSFQKSSGWVSVLVKIVKN